MIQALFDISIIAKKILKSYCLVIDIGTCKPLSLLSSLFSLAAALLLSVAFLDRGESSQFPIVFLQRLSLFKDLVCKLQP